MTTRIVHSFEVYKTNTVFRTITVILAIQDIIFVWFSTEYTMFQCPDELLNCYWGNDKH